jgi:hypothetical protein
MEIAGQLVRGWFTWILAVAAPLVFGQKADGHAGFFLSALAKLLSSAKLGRTPEMLGYGFAKVSRKTRFFCAIFCEGPEEENP